MISNLRRMHQYGINIPGSLDHFRAFVAVGDYESDIYQHVIDRPLTADSKRIIASFVRFSSFASSIVAFLRLSALALLDEPCVGCKGIDSLENARRE